MEVKKIKQDVVKEENSGVFPKSCETIDSLPVEVLSRIIQPLPAVERFRLERVCTKWQRASHNSWSDIKKLCVFEQGQLRTRENEEDCIRKEHIVIAKDGTLSISTDSPAVVRNIVSRAGLKIRTLMFNRSFYKHPVRSKISSTISEYCPNVEVLHMLTTVDTPDCKVFLNICKQCSKLHSFYEQGGSSYMQMLPTKNWKSLRSSPIRRHEGLNEKLVQLISNTDSLNEFQAMYFQSSEVMKALLVQKNLTSLHVDLQSGEMLSDDILKFENLTSLTLTKPCCHSILKESFLDIDFFAELPKHLENLKRLFLTGHFGLKEIVSHILDLKKLETFGFEGFGVTNETLSHLTKFKNLKVGESLYESKYTDSGVLQLIRTSKHLRKLDIARMNVTTGLFEQLVQGANGYCKFLEVKVSRDIRDEVLKICEGSKVIVVENLEI